MSNTWYGVRNCDADCGMFVFRNTISVGRDGKFRCIYSADEVADVFIDGKWVDTGPARGDKLWWYYNELEIELTPGEHTLTMRLLAFGKGLSAAAQQTVRYGIFCKSDALCGKWEYQVQDNCTFTNSQPDWGCFPTIETNSNFNYSAIEGRCGVWHEAAAFQDERELHAPDIPHWICREEKDYRILDDGKRKLVIFSNYVRCRCEYTFSGCGEVRLLWNEAPFDADKKKLHREEWQNCILPGKPAVLKFTSGIRWFDYHYRTGRCLQIECIGDVHVDELKFTAVNYPYEKKWYACCSDNKVNKVLELAWNTLDFCSFESFMDCPYYEQMQYVGDIRIESLISFVTEKNTALPRKGLHQLGRSTDLYGMTLSRFPAWQEQQIPSFSLVWILLLEDYALWQDPDVILPELEHARKNIEFFQHHLDADGLPDFPGWDRISGWDGETGWNFIDWHDTLFRGIPKGNAPLSVLYVLALEAMARIEQIAGNDGEKYRIKAAGAAAKIVEKYYIPEKNILSDDEKKECFSEHSQIFSVLSETMPDCKLELELENKVPAGIYFSYYFLEAAYKLRDEKAFFKRFSKWFDIIDEGLKTLPEEFTHPRSDCHAWSAHVLYHYFATILGIRPRNVKEKMWNIDPLFIDIRHAEGVMTHSTGNIFVKWRKEGNSVQVEYRCPADFKVFHNNIQLPESAGVFIEKTV